MSHTPKETVMVVSDTQFPFHHPDTFDFLEAVQDEYSPTDWVHIGDECFPKEAEVLTPNGWQSIARGPLLGQVMQYNPDGTLEFATPTRGVVKIFTGNMVSRRVGNYFSYTTEGHDLVFRAQSGIIRKQKAGDFSNVHHSIVRTGHHDGPGIPFSSLQIKLAVALSADFTWNPGGSFHGALTKERKKARLMSILDNLGIAYSCNPVKDRPGVDSFYINNQQDLEFCTKAFDHSWLYLMTLEQKRNFLGELKFWDGHDDPARDREIYCSSITSNISFVQTLAHLTGFEASVRDVHSEFGESQQVSILKGKTCTRANTHNLVVPVKELDVYCVTVPSGMILVRQEGKITVSGNCDNHALSDYDHDPDGDAAGPEFTKALKCMKKLYKIFPIMKVCTSNHGARPFRRAKKYGIPKVYLKDYKDFMEAPEGWEWRDKWEIDGVIYEHGEGVSGKQGHLKAALQNMQSTVIGHLHTNAGIEYAANRRHLIFGFGVGCLLDQEKYAFAYQKTQRDKPLIGCGMVRRGIPLFVPMILEKGGRWIGQL